MSNDAVLMGELRSLLALGPPCFPALCRALEGAPAHVVSYVQDHVDGWPALTRRMPGVLDLLPAAEVGANADAPRPRLHV